MVIPFLGVLFETQEKVYNPPPLSFNAIAIKENFYAIISNIIDEQGKLTEYIQSIPFGKIFLKSPTYLPPPGYIETPLIIFPFLNIPSYL